MINKRKPRRLSNGGCKNPLTLLELQRSIAVIIIAVISYFVPLPTDVL